MTPTVPGCVRCEREAGHEGVHVPKYATEENGLLPRRKPVPPVCCFCGGERNKHPHKHCATYHPFDLY